ncbi:phasin family protein [Marinobacterium arenosum]|uniref:phasin family protein n=1 Tax=Marinobacterium arenosum TaxID=2862496 RepID=UPI001C93AF31|nr:phasin family protein [Marinobacterium arenosum]MBY4678990.1 phasin family protein [Marinobacterium arenosum]
MFQDMSKKLNESMEPFKDLINIQTRMLEELTRQQMECTKSCIDATIQQTRELQKCKNSNDLLELQRAYAHELEETLRAAGENNLKVLADARQEIEQLTQDSFDAFAKR